MIDSYDHPHHSQRSSPAKNRMREICTSGSVGGEGGNILAYPAMDAALCAALLAAAAAGAGSCPKAGVAAAAANVANKRKCRCLCIAQLPLVIWRQAPPAGHQLPG
jgi:hypothetical protein